MFSMSRKVFFLSRTSQNITSGSIFAKKNIHEMKNFDQKHGLISLEKCNLVTKENLYFMV